MRQAREEADRLAQEVAAKRAEEQRRQQAEEARRAVQWVDADGPGVGGKRGKYWERGGDGRLDRSHDPEVWVKDSRDGKWRPRVRLSL